MKLYDRLLTVRRALLIALTPGTETVMISYKDKAGKLNVHTIHSDVKKAHDMYLEHWQNTFINYAKNTESLRDMLVNFTKGVQDKWNKENMLAPLRLITSTEYKSSDEDRAKVKRIFADNKFKQSRVHKCVFLNLETAFLDLNPEYEPFVDSVLQHYELFLAKLDSVFYTTNELESDRDFAIAVGHQPYAYVLFRARKTGMMPDHVFSNMPLYYKLKMFENYLSVLQQRNLDVADWQNN